MAVSSLAEISQSRPLASFRNRFLVWAPGMASLIPSPSPTRKTAAWSVVAWSIPWASK
jgi:hypothetical protein